MPLPFLATEAPEATGAPGAPAPGPGTPFRAAAAPPSPGRDRWLRPYRPGSLRVGTAAVLLFPAAYLLLAAVILAAARNTHGAVWCLVCAVLVVAVALRILRIGIWLSGRGLRQVGLCWTSTVRWDRVASVRTVQQPVRWLGLPRTVQGQALVVTRRDGQTLRVLMTDHCADFLRRGTAFDVAADAIEAWAAQLR